VVGAPAGDLKLLPLVGALQGLQVHLLGRSTYSRSVCAHRLCTFTKGVNSKLAFIALALSQILNELFCENTFLIQTFFIHFSLHKGNIFCASRNNKNFNLLYI
jgi:hypothetical protein